LLPIPTDQHYDAVLYDGGGGDGVNFVKQYVQLGMLKKLPLLGQSNTFEKPDVETMPTDIATADTALSPQMAADDLATPAWTTFADAYNKRWGHAPSTASDLHIHR